MTARGNHICEFQFKFPTFLYNSKWFRVKSLDRFPLVFDLLAAVDLYFQKKLTSCLKNKTITINSVTARGSHICKFQFKFRTFHYNSKWFLVKFLGRFPLVFDLLAVQRLISISGKDRHLGRKKSFSLFWVLYYVDLWLLISTTLKVGSRVFQFTSGPYITCYINLYTKLQQKSEFFLVKWLEDPGCVHLVSVDYKLAYNSHTGYLISKCSILNGSEGWKDQ